MVEFRGRSFIVGSAQGILDFGSGPLPFRSAKDVPFDNTYFVARAFRQRRRRRVGDPAFALGLSSPDDRPSRTSLDGHPLREPGALKRPRAILGKRAPSSAPGDDDVFVAPIRAP